MKNYNRSIDLDLSLGSVWNYLSDLNNFGWFNEHHGEIEFLTEQHQGRGTRFKTRHTFWPIFPIPPLETICLVSLWEKKEMMAKVTIWEQPVINIPLVGQAAVPYTQHWQKYTLSSGQRNKTNFRYQVIYQGLPSWMRKANRYVDAKVLEVMDQELVEIKELLSN